MISLKGLQADFGSKEGECPICGTMQRQSNIDNNICIACEKVGWHKPTKAEELLTSLQEAFGEEQHAQGYYSISPYTLLETMATVYDPFILTEALALLIEKWEDYSRAVNAEDQEAQWCRLKEKLREAIKNEPVPCSIETTEDLMGDYHGRNY